jgi:hypothetical protein
MAIADGIGGTSARVVQSLNRVLLLTRNPVVKAKHIEKGKNTKVVHSLNKVLLLKGSSVIKAKRNKNVKDVIVMPEGFFADALTFTLTKMDLAKRRLISIDGSAGWSPDFTKMGLDFQADAVYGWVAQLTWDRTGEATYWYASVDHPLPNQNRGLIRSSSVSNNLLWRIVSDLLLLG